MVPRSRRSVRHRVAPAALALLLAATCAGLGPVWTAWPGSPAALAADPTPPAGPPQPRPGPGRQVDGLPLVGAEPVIPPPFSPATRLAVRRLPRPALPGRCRGPEGALTRANDLLAGKYQLAAFPPVYLGLNPTWREDPYDDRNWQFQYASLGPILSLLEAWVLTADRRYYDRADFLLQDWLADNPRLNPPTIWSWNDHSTALRAEVYACAAPYFHGRPWMTAALDLHGTTLADPAFYVNHGNHALNQSIGLLEVGAVRGRDDWEELAAARINGLIGESVDSQGVTNEQSIAYQSYNLSRYREAQARLMALGLPVRPEFARLDLMTNILAYATLPNGYLEQLGDTDYGPAPVWPGTWAEFAATQGATGPKPPLPYAIYNAGFIFARSGWGETRPFADEVFTSLRFGPAPYIHGHADGTSVTLYGYGSRLLVDPGKFTYNGGLYRQYFKGRTAHNVLTVDGLAWNAAATTKLVGHHETATMIDATLSTAGYSGVSQQRRVTFSRGMNYLLIDDRATATTTRTFRQLWHLDDSADPLVSASTFTTRHLRGNLLVRQLIPAASSRVVAGRASPIQGWVSYDHGVRIPAPVIEVVKSGRSVRYLTLLVPSATTPSVTVSGLVLTATGYSATITIRGHSERIFVNGTSASITALP